MSARFDVAVVGARGVVGRELLRLLEKRRFPIDRLLAFGSSRASVRFQGRPVPVRPAHPKALAAADLAIFAVEAGVAETIAPALARSGTWVIDESSAFRMRRSVPLVIPEINGRRVTEKTRLLSGPNCTTAALLMGVYAIHRAVPIVEIRAASYQAVSGAGRTAVQEFERHARAWVRGRRWQKAKAQPETLIFNVFPQIGGFLPNGMTGEEEKILRESRKILDAPRLKLSSTCVRVPVLRGHSIAVWVRTRRPLGPARARKLIAAAEGVRLMNGSRYPTPRIAEGNNPVYVGRIRAAAPNELMLWIVGDNLLKGAALNSVQIAELLVKKRLLKNKPA